MGLACLLVAACASGPKAGPPPPRERVNIFISPAGEPFHAGANGAYPIDVWFARTDANHDGALTLEEFQADARAFFARLDQDHDGTIDGIELSDYEQKIAPEILPQVGRLTGADVPPLPGENRKTDYTRGPSRESGSGRRGRYSRGGAGAFSLTPEPEPVAAADTDFDGRVSRAEYLATTQRRFERLDLDHDGRLLRSELPSTEAERLAQKAAEYERKRQPERNRK